MLVGSDEWKFLCSQTKDLFVDVVLLNELPFGPWIAAEREFNRDILIESQRAHREAEANFVELGAEFVISTRPVFEGEKSVNQGFVWHRERGIEIVHTKQFIPDEEGYYEMRWFERGQTHFRIASVGNCRIGFLICSEVMFNEWARYYGRMGAELIVVPRATEAETLDRWKTALSMAAIVSGCYVASSNRHGSDKHGKMFGGKGMVFAPTGDLIAETSGEDPVIPVEIDAKEVARAKKGYPCYLKDLEAMNSLFDKTANL